MSSQPLKVLIVDDNRSAANAMARMLKKSGDDVLAVYDGASAIEHIERDPPDIVLTDLKMEPVDGLQVLRSARARRPPVEVVVFTAYGAVDVAVEAMRLGARDFLTKPVTVEQIAERLDQLRPQGQARPAEPFHFVAEDPASQELLAQLRRAAGVPTPVWIEGEIGAGRGYAAQALHHLGGAKGPFTVFDVARDAALPTSGTVLLPSVDDLPDDLQRELHRHVQRAPEGVRLVATAGVDGRRMLAAGQIRPELYYALAVVVVRVPPLRQRPGDVAPLLRLGLEHYARRYGRSAPAIGPERIANLEAHAWPGNVREILNLAERAVVMGADALDFDPIEAAGTGMPKLEPGFSLADYLEGVEKRILEEALRRAGGDRNQAGRILGVERNTLRYKLNKYGLLDR